MAPSIGQVFRPGDEIEASGIYEVVHNPKHTQRHEILCIHGKRFPICEGCAHPRFTLVRPAQLMESNKHFRQVPSLRQPRDFTPE
jgi:hypothetical protein